MILQSYFFLSALSELEMHDEDKVEKIMFVAVASCCVLAGKGPVQNLMLLEIDLIKYGRFISSICIYAHCVRSVQEYSER